MNLLRAFLIFFLTATFHYSASGQHSDTLHSKELLFSKNHLGAFLSYGFNSSSAIRMVGGDEFSGGLGYIYSGGLSYTVNPSPKFGLKLKGGAGAFPIMFNLKQDGILDDDFYYPYFNRLVLTHFAHFSGELEYRAQIGSRYYLLPRLGAGFNAFPNFGVVFGSYASTDSSVTEEWKYYIKFKSDLKPFILGGIGIYKVLNNHDLIGLRLDYQHSFKNAFTGTYSYLPATPDYSYGNFTNKGSSLMLNLEYIFTKAEKQLSAIEMARQGNDLKDIKKNIRYDRRVTRPENSSYVSAGFGLSFIKIIANDPNKIFVSNSIPTIAGSGFFTKEFNQNWLWQAGINYQEYWSGNWQTGWGNAFEALQFSAGSGYIIQNKRKFRYAELHAGIAGAIVTTYWQNKNDTAGWGHGLWSNMNGDTSLYYEFIDFQRNNVFPLLYTGISRDFRIRGRVYFNMMYRYNIGLIKVHESIGTYVSDRTVGVTPYSEFLNGSYSTFQVGFKCDIGRHDKSNR